MDEYLMRLFHLQQRPRHHKDRPGQLQQRYQQIPVEALKAMMLERGASEVAAQGMADMMTAKNQGLDNAEPRTCESTTPTTFRQWCEQVLKPAVLA